MSGQVGWKSESVYGTGVTVDTFMPVINSTLDKDEGYMRPAGIRAGRRTPNPAVLGAKVVSGSLEFELPNLSIAAFLMHMMGAVSTSGSGPYTHEYTPGAHLGKSLTLQVGVTDASDTVRPFTATGTKLTGWEISCAVGDFAKVSADWVAQNVITATSLATASYASGLVPFTFVEGGISVDGDSVASARAVTFRCSKGLKTDRHALGSRLIREPLEQDRFEFSSEISCDFESLDLFALSVAGTQVDSVLEFDNGTDTLTITCSGQVVSATPSLSSNGLEEYTVSIDHSHGSSDASAVTIELVNGESTAA